MVNHQDPGTILDKLILQIFEEQEEKFSFPLTTQKQTRDFVRLLNHMGYTYEMLSEEVKEQSEAFRSWRLGGGPDKIGWRTMKRINKPLQEAMLSDEEEDGAMLTNGLAGSKKQGGRRSLVDAETVKEDVANRHQESEAQHVNVSSSDHEAKLEETEQEETKKKETGTRNAKETINKTSTEDVKQKGGLTTVTDNDNLKISSNTDESHPSKTGTCKEIAKESMRESTSSLTAQDKLKKMETQESSIKKELETGTVVDKKEQGIRVDAEKKEQDKTKDEGRKEPMSSPTSPKIFSKLSSNTSSPPTSPATLELKKAPCSSSSEGIQGVTHTPTLPSPRVNQNTLKETHKVQVPDEQKQEENIREDTKTVAESIRNNVTIVTTEAVKSSKEVSVKPEEILKDKKLDQIDQVATNTAKKTQNNPEVGKSLLGCVSSKDRKNETEDASTPGENKMVRSISATTETVITPNALSSCKSTEMLASDRKISSTPMSLNRSSSDNSSSFQPNTATLSPKAHNTLLQPTQLGASLKAAAEQTSQEGVDESYDSDLDKDIPNRSLEDRRLIQRVQALKGSQRDGPGYVFVLSDTPAATTTGKHRVRLGASRFPDKRLQQALFFNPDLRLVMSVAVNNRKNALCLVHEELKSFSMRGKQGWYWGSLEVILKAMTNLSKDETQQKTLDTVLEAFNPHHVLPGGQRPPNVGRHALATGQHDPANGYPAPTNQANP